MRGVPLGERLHPPYSKAGEPRQVAFRPSSKARDRPERGRPPTNRAGRRGIGFLPAPAKPHSRPTRWMLGARAPQTYPRPLNPVQPDLTGHLAHKAQGRRVRQRAGSLQHEPLHVGRQAVPQSKTPAERAGAVRMQQAAVADRRCGMTRGRPISRAANGAAGPCAPGCTSARGGFSGMSSLSGRRLEPAARTRTPMTGTLTGVGQSVAGPRAHHRRFS